MPQTSNKLDVNVIVSVSKRFITDNVVKSMLLERHDWNTPKLSFRGKTIAQSEVNGKVMYDVSLDEVPGIIIKVSRGSLKYVGPITSSSATEEPENVAVDSGETEDLLEDAIQGDEQEEEEEVDLTPSDGWVTGEVYIDARRGGAASGYGLEKAYLKTNNSSTLMSPLDYFLFFLPLDHFRQIIENTNAYARSLGYWADITFNEYLMWIALLTVMTVVKHSDKKAYWKQGSSNFYMNIDFNKYMSFKRFTDIIKMQVLEVPSKEKQVRDPLYQIRSTIDAFNDHMEQRIEPGKYLVIDESMNQWLGTGMPNLKKVPRKPHPIGQEFKTLADHYSFCILRMDTVSDPCAKEYDNDPGMKKLTATVKRLVKPWFKTGRTVIADSWFGSPDMASMLTKQGLYSIMQVTKRRYWPRGMPTTDIVDSVEEELGSYSTMKKQTDDGQIFVCAYRDQKVKAFVSSCGTTALDGERTFRGSDGNLVTIKRPAVVDEYETHKSRSQFEL
jgi:hypothetical protein